ncbi:MAG: CRISPR-associated protein Cas1 [uncultured Sulfurovum sp.]|uniref:CRISPR-associated endonuclease Cas1 n=1 Tax=uncultured Sulfurovum sp. TaxID=269237 RepID=A0A6S6SNC7_9BACT|nr:MAG: CRISPR-associated protein Cas1 [uncultured Sulfurovum sp.]
MLKIPYTSIFSKSSLYEALKLIKSKGSGLDKESLLMFKKNAKKEINELYRELLAGTYAPQPIEKIAIAKNKKEKRPIALSSVRDKVVQRALVNTIEPHFDKGMSNMSYGYRRNRSTLKAINRCRDFINRGKFWVYKTDVRNFFETINHDTLLNLLDQHIEDKQIVRLISLYLKNGGFKHQTYVEHGEGVHQGDILSPLLSNIYLNEMDKYLERKEIEFVRYADDFVLFFKKKEQIQTPVKELESFLKTLSLHLGEKKSYQANVFKHGFTFLGAFFKDKEVKIDNARLQKKVSALFEIARETDKSAKFVKKVNAFLEGLSFYYLKIIDPQSTQYTVLYNGLIDASSQFVFLQRKAGKIKTKKEFKEAFEGLYFLKEVSVTEHKETVERIVSKGFEKYLATKTYVKDEGKLKSNKQKYAKSFAASSVLYVSQFGAYLGMSKNSITVKVKGKVLAKIPKKQCEQIIIAGKAISLSSNMVYLCAYEGIAIDFVDGRDRPFASIFSAKNAYPKMALMQLELIEKNLSLPLAKAFIRGKSKNQLNYLKYLDRYHNDVEKKIALIEQKIKGNIKKAKTNAELMGYEGDISAVYWQSLVQILESKSNFEGRVTRGAEDLVNASLNYGYAILYARIQHALLKAGLALHISFLHSLQDGKPTLVYDLIEEFRAFVVDRAIVSMINKNEPLKLDAKGVLTKASCHLIVQNVKERLGVYTQHKKASKKVETILQDQAYLLARHVRGEATYKPFIGKY